MDIAEGVAFYDRQGYIAGDYFFQQILEDIDSLSETAGIHERHFGYHRKIASRHPFLIDYRMVTTGVEMVAVLVLVIETVVALKRDPATG